MNQRKELSIGGASVGHSQDPVSSRRLWITRLTIPSIFWVQDHLGDYVKSPGPALSPSFVADKLGTCFSCLTGVKDVKVNQSPPNATKADITDPVAFLRDTLAPVSGEKCQSSCGLFASESDAKARGFTSTFANCGPKPSCSLVTRNPEGVPTKPLILKEGEKPPKKVTCVVGGPITKSCMEAMKATIDPPFFTGQYFIGEEAITMLLGQTSIPNGSSNVVCDQILISEDMMLAIAKNWPGVYRQSLFEKKDAAKVSLPVLACVDGDSAAWWRKKLENAPKLGSGINECYSCMTGGPFGPKQGCKVVAAAPS